MGMITLEDSIRKYSNSQLEEVIGSMRNRYSEEAIIIAEDELTFRKLNEMSTIDQIDYIKAMSNSQIEYVINRSSCIYSPSLLRIFQTECSNRGLEEPEWYYLDNNIPIGPLKFIDLKKLSENSTILPYTLVSKYGDQSWVEASSVGGLFKITNKVIPPIPPSRIDVPGYYVPTTNTDNNESSELGCGLSMISFLIPIIGLIVFFTEKNEKGKNALYLGMAGLIVTAILYAVFSVNEY